MVGKTQKINRKIQKVKNSTVNHVLFIEQPLITERQGIVFKEFVICKFLTLLVGRTPVLLYTLVLPGYVC